MGGIAALFFRRYCNTLARVFYENEKKAEHHARLRIYNSLICCSGPWQASC